MRRPELRCLATCLPCFGGSSAATAFSALRLRLRVSRWREEGNLKTFLSRPSMAVLPPSAFRCPFDFAQGFGLRPQARTEFRPAALKLEGARASTPSRENRACRGAWAHSTSFAGAQSLRAGSAAQKEYSAFSTQHSTKSRESSGGTKGCSFFRYTSPRA